MKRGFDILVAGTGVVLFAPLLILAAVLVKVTSTGPIFFRQNRIGMRFRPFFILKFRSMVQEAPAMGGPITFGRDPRITRIGHFLRQTKLDELPQLLNVLKGDMSLVGPRPEVPHYVEMFREDYEEILEVRPGITDLASIWFRDEATILSQAENPEQEYIEHVLPRKIQLAKQYIQQSSFLLDLVIIFRTLFKLAADRVSLQYAAAACLSSNPGDCFCP